MQRAQARQAVEFRCNEDIVTSALNIQLPNPEQPVTYRITVYGFDQFNPAIRVFAGLEDEVELCTTDGNTTIGDTLTFWDIPTQTIADDIQSAQYEFNSVGNAGQITFTIASVGGGRGRYVAVIEGLILTESGQINLVDVQMGAVALGSPFSIYMVKSADTRIDPFIAQSLFDGSTVSCDDAGSRGCETVQSMQNLLITMSNGTIIQGDRFSAGLQITPEGMELVNLQFLSRSPNATGGYNIVIIGELPVLR
jgi:hypothetical protein